jgi:hypothetical protein
MTTINDALLSRDHATIRQALQADAAEQLRLANEAIGRLVYLHSLARRNGMPDVTSKAVVQLAADASSAVRWVTNGPLTVLVGGN